MKKIAWTIIFLLLIISGVSIYAHFSNYYTVTFISDGKAVKKKIEKGASLLNLDKPEKKGYSFLYWIDDNTIVDKDYKLTYDAILVAVYSKVIPKKTYTVTFNTNGGSEIKEVSVLEKEKVLEPDAPKKTGYVFKEWELNGKSYDFNNLIEEDIKLDAIYIKENVKTYKVSFNTDGGSLIASRVVEESGTVTRPVNPTKAGYAFKEWQLNGKTYNFSTKVMSNITLKAVYTIDNTKTYTVTFDSKGGTSIPSQTVREGSKVNIPVNPTKEGYIFANWLLDSNVFDFSTNITKSITLEAIYTKNPDYESNSNSYVISFNTDGGGNIPIQVIEEGKTIQKPNDPTKEGYTFKEWIYNGQSYDFSKHVTKTMTLVATYIKNKVDVKTYTVVFNTDGGSSISNQVIEEGKTVQKPNDPIKEGYTFKEWRENGVLYNFNDKVMSDITLDAIYTKDAPKEYIITFNTDGGSNIPSQTIEEGNTVQKPSNPIKEGFEFIRWELNGTEYNFNAPVTKNMTLKAVYKVVEIPEPVEEPIENSTGPEVNTQSTVVEENM